jgi:hypothetical protein
MSSDQAVWEAYGKQIEHFRPKFGKEEHITLLDVLADINRVSKLYEVARQAVLASTARVPSTARRDRLYADLVKMKRRALDLMNA